MVSTPFPKRVRGCKEHSGEIVDVEVSTSYYGVLEFRSGVVASLMTSFDIYGARLPIIEIYGSKGTLRVPDPNCFGGPVILHTPEGGDVEIPLAEMASALEKGRNPRAGYRQTLHVLEVLTGFDRAAAQGGYLELTTDYRREAPMAAHMPHGRLD